MKTSDKRKLKIGFLHSLIRLEEKLLIKEFQSRQNVVLSLMDERKMTYDMDKNGLDFDVVMERCINQTRVHYSLKILEFNGVQCINSSEVARICGDKLLTAITLKKHHIPQPPMRVAFSPHAALQAMEELGYPIVLKPTIGSWGRLLSKINDRETAESILAHKTILGSHHHSIFFIQKYIEKKGRDIRVVVIGEKCVAAMYRTSDHWITNAARGGAAVPCPITEKIVDCSLRAARAVGGGLLGIDLFETDDGLLVNELNHTMEFKSCMRATDLDIPKMMVDFVISQAVIFRDKNVLNTLSQTKVQPCAEYY